MSASDSHVDLNQVNMPSKSELLDNEIKLNLQIKTDKENQSLRKQLVICKNEIQRIFGIKNIVNNNLLIKYEELEESLNNAYEENNHLRNILEQKEKYIYIIHINNDVKDANVQAGIKIFNNRSEADQYAYIIKRDIINAFVSRFEFKEYLKFVGYFDTAKYLSTDSRNKLCLSSNITDPSEFLAKLNGIFKNNNGSFKNHNVIVTLYRKKNIN